MYPDVLCHGDAALQESDAKFLVNAETNPYGEQMNPIADMKRTLYNQKFAEHGATSLAVCWGIDEKKNTIRYENFLDLLRFYPKKEAASILDVGCGYGRMKDIIADAGYSITYSGIDVSESMISYAKENCGQEATFHCGDFLKFAESSGNTYDYVLCNGALNDRYEFSLTEMEVYIRKFIKAMFSIATTGIAFNLMSTKVDFFGQHLFYKSPVEMFAWCIDELSPLVELRHIHPRFEYTIYVGRM